MENQTGTNNSFKPVKIKKNDLKKNMRLGNRVILILLFILTFSNFLNAEQKITTVPLINIDEIEPSFENLDEKNDNVNSSSKLKEKRKKI